MREENRDLERPWDEYEWERFMREQDRRNEELEETFGSHLDEAAFNDLLAQEEDADFPQDDVAEHDDDEFISVEDEFIFEGVGCSDEVAEGFNFRAHPAYLDAKQLVESVFDFVEELDDEAEDEASMLLCSVTTAAAKLAAAVTTSGSGEPGMTVAYLKRGLGSVEEALNVVSVLGDAGYISGPDHLMLRGKMFLLRDSIVDMMGDARCEWRRLVGKTE